MEEKSNIVLTAREKMFCRWYAGTGSGREAATRAGYGCRPEQAAVRLLARPEIRSQIDACANENGFRREAAAGLRRLAFGSGTDILRLLQDKQPFKSEELDLFNVSEIKCNKNGTVEIKFFDRQKALEKLADLAQPEPDSENTFYAALERSGRLVSTALQEDCDGR